MDNCIILCIILTVLTLALTVSVVVQKKQMLRQWDRLGHMLEAAIDGSFEEQYFDESRLSAFEARLGQYLHRQAGRERELSGEQANIHGLIADISHQTKTPIANLVLYAGLLLEQVPKESGELACQISRQAEKLQFLIDALIKGSRLEQGILQPVPGEHSVEELLQRCAKEGMPFAGKKGVEIQWQIEEGSQWAYFDPKWTGEALWNLLDNAIKYTHRGDTVLLKGCAYEIFYRIDVIDHGREIPEEEIPRIFQRFYRSGKSNEEEGVGLGLYLAREIVRAQGGYMRVTSGVEVVFSVFLPRRAGT